MPKDFLGNDLRAGDYIVYPGGGNTKAEYGMLLKKIVSVSEDSIRVESLDVRYGPTRAEDKVLRKQSTIKAFTKVVRVTPHMNMTEVFENPDSHAELVGLWIHGRTAINWETLTHGEIGDYV